MSWRLPEQSVVPAWAVKLAISGCVLWSFVQANLGAPGAVRLWIDGWEGILVLMSMGLGLSWAKDVAVQHVAARAAAAQQPDGKEAAP